MTRRSFLATASALAAQPPRVRLGFDTYSLRYLNWRALENLDYAAAQKLDIVQFSLPRDCEPMSPEHLALIRRHAGERGIAIEAGIGSLLPTLSVDLRERVQFVQKGIEDTKALGGNVIRTYITNDRQKLPKGPIEPYIEKSIAILRAALERKGRRPRHQTGQKHAGYRCGRQLRFARVPQKTARTAGVRIAIENHKDLLSSEILPIIQEAGPDHVGLCLDTGNAPYLAEDPSVILDQMSQHVFTTHIRDASIYAHPRGASVQWVPLGEGTLDLKRFTRTFAARCKDARFVIENITGRPAQLVPFLDDGYWNDKKHASGAGFVSFLQLVAKGQPYAGRLVMFDVEGFSPPPAIYLEAMQHQQREHLERGFAFARKVLS